MTKIGPMATENLSKGRLEPVWLNLQTHRALIALSMQHPCMASSKMFLRMMIL